MFSNENKENIIFNKLVIVETTDYTAKNTNKNSLFFTTCYANIYYRGNLVHTVRSWVASVSSCRATVMYIVLRWIELQEDSLESPLPEGINNGLQRK